jgi:hypothetical protein
MKINRRKFVQSTSMVLLGSLIPLNTYSNIISANAVDKKLSSKNLSERLKKASDLRKNGKIERSKRKFLKIIEDYPYSIIAYDGLRKSLLQDKFQELEVLQLYEKGFALNPDNKDFKERLAKEYMRLILGNKKYSKQNYNSENLLVKSRKLFKELKEDYPERKEYKDLLKKVKRKIKQNADSVDARKNNELKTFKKYQRKKFRKRFDNENLEGLQNKLDKLLNKPKNISRSKNIKELYNLIISSLRKEKNWREVFRYSLALYQFDKTDSKSIQKVKKYAIKTKNFDKLVEICSKNNDMKKTFWSQLSFFDSYFKRYKKEKKGNILKLQQILSELDKKITDTNQLIEVQVRSIKLSLLEKKFIKTESNLIDLGKLLSGTENCHLAVRYCVLLARFYSIQKDYQKSIEIIQYALGDSNNLIDPYSKLSICVTDVNQAVTIKKAVHKKRLDQVLSKLQSRQNI